jgi:hypothetical protein
MKYLKNNKRPYKVYYESKQKEPNKKLPNFNTTSKIYPEMKKASLNTTQNFSANQNFGSCNNFHQPKNDKLPNYSNNYIKLSDIPDDSKSFFNSTQKENFSNDHLYENNFNENSNIGTNQNQFGNAFGNFGGLAQILSGLGNGNSGMAGGLQSLLPLLGGMNGGNTSDLISNLSKNNPNLNLSSIMGLLSGLNKTSTKPAKRNIDKEKDKKYIKIADYYVDN